MAVNPNLAALMRVIEDNQDKMPEGEYLEAMNALGALHRQIPAPAAAPMAAAAAVPPPFGGNPPPSYAASAHLFHLQALPLGMDRVEHAAWFRVKHDHPEYAGISAEDWMELSPPERNQLLCEATEVAVNRCELRCTNPEPEVCPFIARHAVGPWRMSSSWECVCGYKGLCRNWQKHEHSERHEDWAKHRTVSRRRIDNMKKSIQRDEAGELVRYKPLSLFERGGIRYFLARQERNEWTHPELYSEVHRTADPEGKWFVHSRQHLERQYVE